VKITVEINVGTTGFAQSYTVVETRAPRAYDYHGVIQVEDGGTTRIVALPDEDAPIQTARYQSGMYGVRAVEDADEGTLLDLLVARLLTCKCQ
jgi:hypothetical protein